MKLWKRANHRPINKKVMLSARWVAKSKPFIGSRLGSIRTFTGAPPWILPQKTSKRHQRSLFLGAMRGDDDGVALEKLIEKKTSVLLKTQREKAIRAFNEDEGETFVEAAFQTIHGCSQRSGV